MSDDQEESIDLADFVDLFSGLRKMMSIAYDGTYLAVTVVGCIVIRYFFEKKSIFESDQLIAQIIFVIALCALPVVLHVIPLLARSTLNQLVDCDKDLVIEYVGRISANDAFKMPGCDANDIATIEYEMILSGISSMYQDHLREMERASYFLTALPVLVLVFLPYKFEVLPLVGGFIIGNFALYCLYSAHGAFLIRAHNRLNGSKAVWVEGRLAVMQSPSPQLVS